MSQVAKAEIEAGNRIGLALSGGGFRATLFHLGVVQKLYNTGQLSKIKVITAVSGGSIMAAHLCLNWKAYNGSRSDFETVAAELRALAALDLRAEVVANTPLIWLRRVVSQPLRRLFERRPKASRQMALSITRTLCLARLYDKYLFNGAALKQLKGDSDAPDVRLMATNLTLNNSWTYFSAEGMSIMSPRGSAKNEAEKINCDILPLGIAVAASSAFPIFFEALEISPGSFELPEGRLEPRRQYLTDGGVFDNLGIGQLLLEKQRRSTGEQLTCLVSSDGSGANTTDASTDYRSFVPRLGRVSDIMQERISLMHKEALGSEGISIGIGDIVADNKSLLSKQVQEHLQFIRTDLDAFNQDECECLAAHGYACAADKLPWPDTEDRKDHTPAAPEAKDADLLKKIRDGAKRRTGWRRLICNPLIFYYLLAGGGAFSLGYAVLLKAMPEIYCHSSIGPLLDKKIRVFGHQLDSSAKNLYFVGLSTSVTFRKFPDEISEAVKRDVKLNFYIYLPRASAVQAPSDAEIEGYRGVFTRYRPNGNDTSESLEAAWRDLVCNPTFTGGLEQPASSELIAKNLKQYFYSDRPIGWLLAFDVADDFSSARKMYWFPYLAQAEELDRPGLELESSQPLGRHLLSWLSHLVTDSGTREMSESELIQWKGSLNFSKSTLPSLQPLTSSASDSLTPSASEPVDSSGNDPVDSSGSEL